MTKDRKSNLILAGMTLSLSAIFGVLAVEAGQTCRTLVKHADEIGRTDAKAFDLDGQPHPGLILPTELTIVFEEGAAALGAGIMGIASLGLAGVAVRYGWQGLGSKEDAEPTALLPPPLL